ncbi:hypothetical protein Dimus_000498 [Dionaea muscipula]
MATKALSISLCLPSTPHRSKLPISNPKSRYCKSRFNLILCRTTAQSGPQTGQDAPNSGTQVPDHAPYPDGTGAAAPTRGQIFLEHHQSKAASKLLLAAEKKRTSKSEKQRIGFMKGLNSVASCYGCGAPLQTVEVDGPGYVDRDTYELKKKHHQLRTVLCGRCQLLSHGHMITAVGGHGGYPGGKKFVTAEQLRDMLSHLRHEKALIVKLVDIVDFSGSFLSRVRDLIGANPIILVITKVDLLPKGTDLNCIGDWVVEATAKKRLNVLSVHLTSSKSKIGITGVVSEIQKEKKLKKASQDQESRLLPRLVHLLAEESRVCTTAQFDLYEREIKGVAVFGCCVEPRVSLREFGSSLEGLPCNFQQ